MKVITQLIRHFWQRGALTAEQAEYLLDQGFARPADLPGYQPPVHAEPGRPEQVVEPPHRWDIVAEQLERPARKRGGGGPKGVVPEAEDLQLWLRKQFARRARHGSALVALANRFARCANWHDAAVILRQQRPDRFVKSLSAALRSGQISLRNLWLAVDPEPFHARMEDASLRGPTVRAFRMLLALRNASHLGKYVWILKLNEVQAALNLMMVHRQLLIALGAMFQHHRPTLTAALGQSTHPVPQWGLVLVHNAQPAIAPRTVNRRRANMDHWRRRMKACGGKPGRRRS